MKRLFGTLALSVVFALMITGTAFAVEPDWGSTVGPYFRDSAHSVPVDVDISGYVQPSDVGPYALAWMGGEYDIYCNTDREVQFVNWVSMAQWMRIQVDNMNLVVLIRKPGVYTVGTPMSVRIASNGEVLVTFQELWGSDEWDAEWYEFSDKLYPRTAPELEPQIPIDKKYKVNIIGEVYGTEPTGFTDVPAGDEKILFKNTEALHNLENPSEGFDLTFQELPVPCNTVGDYVLIGRMVFQAANQMWYIDPLDGTIDVYRDSGATPPAPYPGL